MRRVYGNGEVKELLFKYATVLLQRENRIKQKKVHRNLQAKLE